MCFNGFKVSGRLLYDYLNTYQLECALSSQSQSFTIKHIKFTNKYIIGTYVCDYVCVVPILLVCFI